MGVLERQGRDRYHVMTLSAMGEAETPAGGSVCIRCGEWWVISPCLHALSRLGKVPRNRFPFFECLEGDKFSSNQLTLKSRIRRRRAEVDIMVYILS